MILAEKRRGSDEQNMSDFSSNSDKDELSDNEAVADEQIRMIANLVLFYDRIGIKLSKVQKPIESDFHTLFRNPTEVDMATEGDAYLDTGSSAEYGSSSVSGSESHPENEHRFIITNVINEHIQRDFYIAVRNGNVNKALSLMRTNPNLLRNPLTSASEKPEDAQGAIHERLLSKRNFSTLEKLRGNHENAVDFAHQMLAEEIKPQIQSAFIEKPTLEHYAPGTTAQFNSAEHISRGKEQDIHDTALAITAAMIKRYAPKPQ
jgi:hypothetical protein